MRRHGVRGGARRLGGRARNPVYLREDHFGYGLDLGQHPPLPLPVGLELLRAGASDLELVERLRTGSVHQAESKVSEDNAPSRRAVEKAGFRETASMRLARTGFRVKGCGRAAWR